MILLAIPSQQNLMWKVSLPMMANIKVYDSTNTQIASTPSAASITGGDVFAVN
jgi:hypothetical protein